jgi:hypothetical protein
MPAPYWTPKADRLLKAIDPIDLCEINQMLTEIRQSGGLSVVIDDQPEMYHCIPGDGRF